MRPDAPVALSAGETRELSWLVPDIGGFPIAEIGLESDGEVELHWLTWDGTPQTCFRPTDGGGAWRDTWVNGVDRFEGWGEPFRLIQNSGTGLLIQGCREWRDYEVGTRMAIHLVERAGIAAHVQGMRRWIGFFLCRDGFARLVKSLDGEQVLAEASFSWQFDQTYDLRLAVSGSQFKAFVNGNLVLEAEDRLRPLGEGAIAFVVTEGRVGAHEMTIAPLRG